MPHYRYKNVNGEGLEGTGLKMAADEEELEELLAAEGLWLVEAEVGPAPLSRQREKSLTFLSAPRLSFRPRIRRRTLIEFSIQMAVQTRSGISLLVALEDASRESENPAFQRILKNVLHLVESGSTLSEAMRENPAAFQPQMTSLVQAGESSGRISESFEEIRKTMEWTERLLADIRQASIYPAFILGSILLFLMLLFTFVLPRFVVLFDELDAGLPAITQLVFALSDVAASGWWLWILIWTAPPAFGIACRYSCSLAFMRDGWKLKIPVFGGIHRMIALSRFSHNLAGLYRAGIPILDSLALCRGLVGNRVIETALAQVERDVAEGAPLSEALRRRPVFTRLLVRMVAIGEKTGSLHEVMERVADYYNDAIPRRVKQVFSVLEPAAILFMVGLASFVALALFLPIVTLMDHL